MKGMHWTIILAIIIFVVLLVIMLIVFIGPLTGQGSVFFNQTEFRRYCAWWATTDYKGTNATVENEQRIKEPYDMTDLCTQALSLQCPPTRTHAECMNDDSNWERCKDMCRVAYTKV